MRLWIFGNGASTFRVRPQSEGIAQTADVLAAAMKSGCVLPQGFTIQSRPEPNRV